jgi:hypothetical protein
LALSSLSCQTTAPGELVPFTTKLRTAYNLSEPELWALQYYISARVVIERRVSSALRDVDRGRLVVRGGNKIHQILIEFGTPGVIEEGTPVGSVESGDALAVSFDLGSPLRFHPARSDGSYTLAPPGGLGLFSQFLADLGRPRRFEVDFENASWRVVTQSRALLMIERSALGKLVPTRRTLPGVRIPDAR